MVETAHVDDIDCPGPEAYRSCAASSDDSDDQVALSVSGMLLVAVAYAPSVLPYQPTVSWYFKVLDFNREAFSLVKSF